MSIFLGLARLVPWWLYVVAGVLGLLAWQRHQVASATKAAAVAEQRAAVEAATAQAESAAREREHELITTTTKAADAYRSNLAAARGTAAGARTERDRLLDVVASRPATCPASPGASAAGGIAGDPELRKVLGSCVAALQELGAAADEDATRLIGLQSYVRAIGAAPSAPTTERTP